MILRRVLPKCPAYLISIANAAICKMQMNYPFLYDFHDSTKIDIWTSALSQHSLRERYPRGTSPTQSARTQRPLQAGSSRNRLRHKLDASSPIPIPPLDIQEVHTST